jgi:hypothetical protein
MNCRLRNNWLDFDFQVNGSRSYRAMDAMIITLIAI